MIPFNDDCIAHLALALLDGPVLMLVGVCTVLCILACVYLWKLSDQNEWEASSLRRQESLPVEVPQTVADAPVTPNEANASEETNRFQRFVEYPIFLGYAGLALGGLIPALFIIIAGGDALEDTRYELIVFYGVLFLWNFCFTLLFKFRLKLPIIPIPISWVTAPLVLLGFWDLCFGSY